jgi:hypothetical protein
MRRNPSRSALVLLAAGALAMSAATPSQEQPPQEQEQEQAPQQQSGLPPGQVPAVLKARDADFVYRSSSRLFTCEQLRSRVAVILRAVGARQDVSVRANECEAFIDPTQMTDPNRSDRRNTLDPRNQPPSVFDRVRPSSSSLSDRNRNQSTPVRIQLMMPVEVTSEVVQEVEQDKARRALISRVTGNPNASMDDAIFFAAERRQVTLSHDTIRLEAIDCELLEQMSMTVFRQLDLKVTSQALSCDPRERSRLLPSLTVEALLPVGFQLPSEQEKKK